MKIEYNDGSYIEFKKINDKIQLTIAANKDKQLIVNSVLVNLTDFEKVIKELQIKESWEFI